VKRYGRKVLKRSLAHAMESSTSPDQYEPRRTAAFVASISLRPEQYRAVTPFSKSNGSNHGEADVVPGCTSTTPTIRTASTSAKPMYQYPAVPLSFTERKRMSDTLFYLSQEIPTLTTDCASILQIARQNNEWDIAVAELLAQVIVALYCGEGDLRLDGLQQYLLSLGIAC
jgi:hypothetical protein